MKLRLTELQRLQVVSEDARKLGRLMDLRTRSPLGPPDRVESLEPVALLVGPSGWLEEMGLRHADACEVAVARIVRVSSGEIVVRAPVRSSEGPRKRRRRR